MEQIRKPQNILKENRLFQFFKSYKSNAIEGDNLLNNGAGATGQPQAKKINLNLNLSHCTKINPK